MIVKDVHSRKGTLLSFFFFKLNHVYILQIIPANTDWSHPLLQVQFEHLNSGNNAPSINSLKAPVILNREIYALGRDHLNIGCLLKYSIIHNEWSKISVPTTIYTSYSVLTTYLSKLILISGQNGTVWEFDCNYSVFKESCIEPVPGWKVCHWTFDVASQDKYLIVASDTLFRDDSDIDDHAICVHIFDGTSWSVRQYDSTICLTLRSHESQKSITTIIDNHTIFEVELDAEKESYVTCIFKAPLLLEESEDTLSVIEWERIYVNVCRSYGYPGQQSLLLLNNQQLLFLADSQGKIFTIFIQPTTGAVEKFKIADGGYHFRQAPHLVGLPNGELLMVGRVILDDNCKSQLDVIKVHHKGTMIVFTLVTSHSVVCVNIMYLIIRYGIMLCQERPFWTHISIS